MLQPGNSGDPTLAIAETITQRGIRYATAKRFAPPKIAPFNQGSPDGERGPICPQAPSKLAFLTGVQQQLQMRSEEHTSELQSLMRISYAVFCLKKKNTQ